MKELAYLCGQAKILEGENEKLSAYVNHAVILGAMRERIIKRMIRDDIADKYTISTGIIRSRNRISKQIDLIIHSTFEHKPLYQYEDVVVLAAEDASLTIEVKSYLDKDKFGEFLGNFDRLMEMFGYADYELRSGHSFRKPEIPAFGYFLDGVKADTCMDYVIEAYGRETYKANNGTVPIRWMNTPILFCNHEQRYVFLRNGSTCFLIEFPPHTTIDGTMYSGSGMVYGVFADVLQTELNNQTHYSATLHGPYITYLYNNLSMASKRYYLDPNTMCFVEGPLPNAPGYVHHS